VSSYNGACPECGRADRVLNVGSTHWGYCPDDKLRWLIGSNLFSGWKHETEGDWIANELTLRDCSEVEPA
jgi:hypothetical protein